MRGYFSFDVLLPGRPQKRQRWVFCSTSLSSATGLIERLQADSEVRPPPDEIHTLCAGTEAERLAIGNAVDSPAFRNRFRDLTRYHDPPPITTWFFDDRGIVSTDSGRKLTDDELSRLRHVGMVDVFRRRGGLLHADGGFHYAKPSRGHSSSFLRVGNVMVYGAEIDFLAFGCLPFAPEDLRHIYCDTGAIHPVALSISALRHRIRPELSLATIDSFGSYEGLNDFRFSDADRSLVLISASTSSGLACEIQRRDPNVSEDRIATLFFLGNGEPRRIVCDLRRTDSDTETYSPFESYPEDRCPLCARGSTCIRIEGDQFLFGATKTDRVMIKVKDAPPWLNDFLLSVFGKNLIRANYRQFDSIREIHFDLAAMFADAELLGIKRWQSRFAWMICQNVPVEVKRIIHLDDPASRAMATAIVRRLPPSHANIPLHSFADVHRQPANFEAHTGAALIVAGAAATGRSLLGVSKDLRQIQTNGAVHYMIGLARLPSNDELKELRSNLAFGEQPQDHGFWTLESLQLPADDPRKVTSWDDEFELLKQLEPADEAVRQLIESRQRELAAAGSDQQQGMTSNLFWRTSSNEELRLRPGFAFADFRYETGQISQAETYFVVTAVLHRLRTEGERRLQQAGFVRRVLSPRCFDRFNDGVIQAAFLRAALPAELDYSTTPGDSAEMTQILKHVFEHHTGQIGEAAREFALALAAKKLRLRDFDLHQLKELIRGSTDPVLNCLSPVIFEGIA